MSGKFQQSLATLAKSLLAIALVAFVVLGCIPRANAGALNTSGLNANGIGGSSWNRAKPTAIAYAPPSHLYEPGGGFYSGEAIGFPLLLPFFGLGGGSIVMLLIAIAISNYLGDSFRREDDTDEPSEGSSIVSVTRLSVALLARGQHLQTELESLEVSGEDSEDSEDSSGLGLRETLHEVALALLRHPEYWVYGSVKTQRARLVTVRSMFERLALAERNKVEPEKRFQFSDRLLDKTEAIASKGYSLETDIQGSGDYIILTLLVGLKGNLPLPAINSKEDLHQALSQISEIDSDRLEAVDIIWNKSKAKL
ncbi:MAG: DUF1517 domain-containing protein [Oscillatoria sp. SIO1A7]|nr:DUF1517 domain-containing protein [Oscillatoria sp. SIO1A7]